MAESLQNSCPERNGQNGNGGGESVSYTHLDVYKRQIRNRAGEVVFSHMNVAKDIKERFHVPVFINNDVNNILLYDIMANGLEEQKVVVGIYIGTGVGLSLIHISVPVKEKEVAHYGGWGFYIPTDSKNPEVAWVFMQWFNTPEVQKNIALDGGFPNLQSCYEDEELKEIPYWEGSQKAYEISTTCLLYTSRCV